MKTIIIRIAIMLAFALSPAVALCADSPAPTPVPSKLQSALADMVNKSVQIAGDAKDFLVAQLPDVIRQLLLWKFFEKLIPMVFFFAAFLFMSQRVSALIKRGDFQPVPHPGSNYQSDPKNGYPLMIWGIAKCVLTLALLLAFLFTMNLTWLQIWIAPKVYLIEYAKSLVSQ